MITMSLCILRISLLQINDLFAVCVDPKIKYIHKISSIDHFCYFRNSSLSHEIDIKY